MSHIYVNENGNRVCKHCGEAEIAHYWNNDQTYEIMKRFTPIQTVKDKKLDVKWKRLLQLNSRLTLDMNHHLYIEILTILNLLPLSSGIKKQLHSYMINKNFKSYKQVYETFYKLICIHDFPLTSTEFLKILNTGKKNRYKPLTKIQNVESVRKYYWYITEQIEKARKILDFSHEDGQRIYKIVFDYYNLIRFKMLKALNPTYLIHNLIYYTIREKLRPNQSRFNKRNFEIVNTSFISTLIRCLKEIKVSKTDSKFAEKLKISKRNMKLQIR